MNNFPNPHGSPPPHPPYGYGGPPPGDGKATAAMVCGIVSVSLVFFYGAGLIPGIIGLVLAGMAKKEGFVGGKLTAGLVLSIIGLSLSALIFMACMTCIGFMIFDEMTRTGW